MTVYAPLIGTLWQTLESYGVDPAILIPKKIYRPGAEPGGSGDRISIDAYEELLTQAAALLDDPAVGLHAATFLHPSHLGALGHAWMASSSLRNAILRLQRFHRILNEQLTVHVTEPQGFFQVEYRQPGSKQIRSEQFDARLGTLLQLCRLNFGPHLVPAYVRMVRPEPADPEPWALFFGTPVEFGEALNCLALHQRDVDKPLTVSSTQLVSQNEEVMARYLAKLDMSNIINRVRVSILDLLPSGDLTVDNIAVQLNMSPRTLHNRLQNQGITFRSMLLELRKDLVRRYIDDDSYSITEISFLLGYANTSSFSRAFRSWFGISPSEYRR